MQQNLLVLSVQLNELLQFCKHYHNHGIEHFHHSRKFPPVPYAFPPPTPKETPVLVLFTLFLLNLF